MTRVEKKLYFSKILVNKEKGGKHDHDKLLSVFLFEVCIPFFLQGQKCPAVKKPYSTGFKPELRLLFVCGVLPMSTWVSSDCTKKSVTLNLPQL